MKMFWCFYFYSVVYFGFCVCKIIRDYVCLDEEIYIFRYTEVGYSG